MEIEQYLYDLTDSGEAIVAYSMRSNSGAVVQLCNMGASVLSFTMPNEEGGADDIASGPCTKGLVDDKESFEERLWESRVEVNRVIMSLSYDCEGVGVMSEVVFDFDDENSLEITYQACLEGSAPFDLSHRLTFNLGGEERLKMECDSCEDIYLFKGAQQGILSEIATLEGRNYEVDILSSHPAIKFDGESLTTLQSPVQIVEDGARYVQKSLFRAKKRS